jgi:hypothetical protein
MPVGFADMSEYGEAKARFDAAVKRRDREAAEQFEFAVGYESQQPARMVPRRRRSTRRS